MMSLSLLVDVRHFVARNGDVNMPEGRISRLVHLSEVELGYMSNRILKLESYCM